jgi:hypothetical protein
MQIVNNMLGNPPAYRYNATPAGFEAFVAHLTRRGAVDIDEHFRHATYVTDAGAFRYEFYLPLEEMGQWLPCVSEVSCDHLSSRLVALEWGRARKQVREARLQRKRRARSRALAYGSANCAVVAPKRARRAQQSSAVRS